MGGSGCCGRNNMAVMVMISTMRVLKMMVLVVMLRYMRSVDWGVCQGGLDGRVYRQFGLVLSRNCVRCSTASSVVVELTVCQSHSVGFLEPEKRGLCILILLNRTCGTARVGLNVIMVGTNKEVGAKIVSDLQFFASQLKIF